MKECSMIEKAIQKLSQAVRRAEDGARYPLSSEDTIWFLKTIQEDVETAIDILQSISEEGGEL